MKSRTTIFRRSFTNLAVEEELTVWLAKNRAWKVDARWELERWVDDDELLVDGKYLFIRDQYVRLRDPKLGHYAMLKMIDHPVPDRAGWLESHFEMVSKWHARLVRS